MTSGYQRPARCSIVQAFFESAATRPTSVALSTTGACWTYEAAARSVEVRATWLASRLPRAARVGILCGRSPEIVLWMLACMRAGLAYVPVDARAPAARVRTVLAETEVRLLIAEDPADATVAALPPSLERVAAGAPVSTATRGDVLADVPWPEADELAYILTTSGSTGHPKKVTISHGNCAAFVAWAVGAFALGPPDRMAVHAPLHFDLPVLDVFGGLTAGARVLPIPEQDVRFPAAVLRFLARERATTLYAVPSALIALRERAPLAASGLPDLRRLLFAGEPFAPAALARLLDLLPQARVYNLYGPIETNVVTWSEILPSHLLRDRLPIGRAVDGTRILLRTEDGSLREGPGVEGEIVAFGPTVTPGYLADDELNRRTRLLHDLDGEGARTGFRTGDWARWRADGDLELLGRRDRMVKTRGHRVELDEVEGALLRHPDVAEAAVVALPVPDHGLMLHAAIVARGGADVSASAILATCRAELPTYMVPYRVQIRRVLPYTSTGKIDRLRVAEELSAVEGES